MGENAQAKQRKLNTQRDKLLSAIADNLLKLRDKDTSNRILGALAAIYVISEDIGNAASVVHETRLQASFGSGDDPVPNAAVPMSQRTS